MPYFDEDWLLEIMRSDGQFLRKMRIKSCLLDDPCPKPPPAPFTGDFEDIVRHCDMTHIRFKERHGRLTRKDAEWLKAVGTAWKERPAFQLPLDFRERP